MEKVIKYIAIVIIAILVIIPGKNIAHRVFNPTEVLPNNASNQLVSGFVEKVFNYSYKNIEDIPGQSYFDPKSNDHGLPLNVAEIKAYKKQENLLSEVNVLSVFKNNWFSPDTVNIVVDFATLVSDDKSNYIAYYSGTVNINEKTQKVVSVKLDQFADVESNRTIDETFKEKLPLIKETVSHHLRLKHNYSYNSLSAKKAAGAPAYSNELSKNEIKYAIARERSEQITSEIMPDVVSIASDNYFMSRSKAIVKCEFTSNYDDGGNSSKRRYQGYVYLTEQSDGWKIERDNTFPLNTRFASTSLN